MNDFDYDLIVIGAGSGGTRTARIAAGYGAKTAVIEGEIDQVVHVFYVVVYLKNC